MSEPSGRREPAQPNHKARALCGSLSSQHLGTTVLCDRVEPKPAEVIRAFTFPPPPSVDALGVNGPFPPLGFTSKHGQHKQQGHTE